MKPRNRRYPLNTPKSGICVGSNFTPISYSHELMIGTRRGIKPALRGLLAIPHTNKSVLRNFAENL